MKDIATRHDVQLLVDSFYNQVKSDQLLSPVFSHLNWHHHLPIMYNFWSSILLGDQSYQGSPLQKHLTLPIQAEHFTRWLELFHQTVDQHFSGAVASEAKVRASTIARLFMTRMSLLT